jgi:hypothetical protein
MLPKLNFNAPPASAAATAGKYSCKHSHSYQPLQAGLLPCQLLLLLLELSL